MHSQNLYKSNAHSLVYLSSATSNQFYAHARPHRQHEEHVQGVTYAEITSFADIAYERRNQVSGSL